MKRILQIGILVLIFLMVGVFALHRFEEYHRSRINQVKAFERKYWMDQNKQLEEKIARLEGEIKNLKVSPGTRQKVSEVFKEEPRKLIFPEGEPTLEKTVYQLVTFFSYLDQQDYVKDRQLNGGSQQAFRQAIEALLEAPPLFTAELATLDSLTQNLNHFRTVLGEPATELFKEIFSNESELLETVLNAFYHWSDLCEENPNNIIACPTLPRLYDYASFFLGTFAGRNYLFECHPKLRALINYYSILIVDRALDAQNNPNGIDIRQHIRSSLRSIRMQKDLVGLDGYLETLKSLAKKYQLT
jgi:hypothetical protein